MTDGSGQKRPKMTRAELLELSDRLAVEVARLEAESDRLERSLGRALEANRALGVLIERAEQDRDVALQRLSTVSHEANDWRHQLREARAMLQQLATEQEA